MRRGFTLLELLIAVSLLSIIMLYLYQSLSTLQEGNRFYGETLKQVNREQKLLKVLYLDLALSEKGSVTVVDEDRNHDIVLMQTAHSIHHRIMPYVGYVINQHGLFRIESSQELTYPLRGDEEMQIDPLGAFDHFRVYRTKTHFLVDIWPLEGEQQLFKVRGYNQ